MTLAILSLSGNFPLEKEILTIFVKGMHNTSAESFSMPVGMLCGPKDFDSSILEISFKTSDGVTSLRKKDFSFEFFK